LDTIQDKYDLMVEFLTPEVNETTNLCFHGQYCFEYTKTENEEGKIMTHLTFYKDEDAEYEEAQPIEGCGWLNNNVLIKKEAHFLANQLEQHLESLDDGDLISVSYSESWDEDTSAEEELTNDVEDEETTTDLILEAIAEMSDDEFESFIASQYTVKSDQETIKGRALSMVSELSDHDWAFMFATYSEEDWAAFFASFTP